MITIPGLENYFGGKGASGTYQTIINEIPPHDNYIEPFLGAGNILRRKLPAKSINKGLDLDKNIIDIWDKYAPGNFDIKQGDGIMLLNSLAAGNHLFNGTTFIYIDPPYLMSSRKSTKKQYRFELTDTQHEQILRSVTKINRGEVLPTDKNIDYIKGRSYTHKNIVTYRPDIFIAISCLENDMYKEYLKDWRCITFYNQTRHGQQLEFLYMNYPKPKELHQYNFLGIDYREREKIQNQIKRNVTRLKRMNPLLLNAIVSAINKEFNNSVKK